MKKKTRNNDEPINLRVIEDYLPSPEHLMAKEENVKVMITLSKSSVDFFKKYARATHSHYQTMVRKVIDYYVMHHAL